eukprot:3657533-Pleurochrysis_carterae.AAC.5
MQPVSCGHEQSCAARLDVRGAATRTCLQGVRSRNARVRTCEACMLPSTSTRTHAKAHSHTRIPIHPRA